MYICMYICICMYIKIPKWPMKAVSIREAIGSAATASAEGKAIPNNSRESASSLKTCLHINK